MNNRSASKSKTGLTRESLERLLAQLDPDWNRAGEKYEKIRERLLKFFRWRECAYPEEYTDQTIDRVARRIAEGGVELQNRDPYLYFHGVALNVLREYWKEPHREMVALDLLPREEAPATNPELVTAQVTETLDREQRLNCLDACVEDLSADSLALITQYHHSEGRTKIDNRRRLADRLGIPLNALRIRAHRIRGQLESCIENCLGQRKPMK